MSSAIFTKDSLLLGAGPHEIVWAYRGPVQGFGNRRTWFLASYLTLYADHEIRSTHAPKHVQQAEFRVINIPERAQ